MATNRLSVAVQGVKGKVNENIRSNVGRVRVNLTNDNNGRNVQFTFDVFEGFGDTYKRRENEGLIEIQDNFGNIIFKGDFNKLAAGLDYLNRFANFDKF